MKYLADHMRDHRVRMVEHVTQVLLHRRTNGFDVIQTDRFRHTKQDVLQYQRRRSVRISVGG